MKKYEIDTSESYDHMVDFVSDETLNHRTLEHLLDEDFDSSEYKPEVRKKEGDKNYPEQWQTLMVSVYSFEDFAAFMQKMGSSPSPKMKDVIYSRPEEKTGIENFFGD